MIATDPDGDRVGVLVPSDKSKEEYILLDGNEIGILMFDYICNQKKILGKMPKNPVAVRTIVSSRLFDKIAKENGVKTKNVMTGFKNIGKEILKLEKEGREEDFIFGFEESNGYLCGSYVRDKDGVFAATFLCEIASFYKRQNKTLFSILNLIYEKYGYCLNRVESFVFSGKEGRDRMKKIMNNLRNLKLEKIGNFKIEKIRDYFKGMQYNLKTNQKKFLKYKAKDILEYRFCNKASLVVRPSGTEPKIKTYFSVLERTEKEARTVLKQLVESFKEKRYIT